MKVGPRVYGVGRKFWVSGFGGPGLDMVSLGVTFRQRLTSLRVQSVAFQNPKPCT